MVSPATPERTSRSVGGGRTGLVGQGRSLAEAWSMPGLADVELEPSRVRIGVPPPDPS